jgi:hypothetical protein
MLSQSVAFQCTDACAGHCGDNGLRIHISTASAPRESVRHARRRSGASALRFWQHWQGRGDARFRSGSEFAPRLNGDARLCSRME